MLAITLPIAISLSQQSQIGFPIDKQHINQSPLSQLQVLTIASIYYIDDYVNIFTSITLPKRKRIPRLSPQ